MRARSILKDVERVRTALQTGMTPKAALSLIEAITRSPIPYRSTTVGKFLEERLNSAEPLRELGEVGDPAEYLARAVRLLWTRAFIRDADSTARNYVNTFYTTGGDTDVTVEALNWAELFYKVAGTVVMRDGRKLSAHLWDAVSTADPDIVSLREAMDALYSYDL